MSDLYLSCVVTFTLWGPNLEFEWSEGNQQSDLGILVLPILLSIAKNGCKWVTWTSSTITSLVIGNIHLDWRRKGTLYQRTLQWSMTLYKKGSTATCPDMYYKGSIKRVPRRHILPECRQARNAYHVQYFSWRHFSTALSHLGLLLSHGNRCKGWNMSRSLAELGAHDWISSWIFLQRILHDIPYKLTDGDIDFWCNPIALSRNSQAVKSALEAKQA